MKEYFAPEIEIIEYNVEDCLTGSTDVPIETQDIGSLIDDLT